MKNTTNQPTDFQQNFEAFTKELAELSKKYGIVIEATGSVYYGELAEVEYSDDLYSGDLRATTLVWADGTDESEK